MKVILLLESEQKAGEGGATLSLKVVTRAGHCH